MSLKAEIVLEWADGEDHLFALKGAQIEELQAQCNAGLGVIHLRVLSGGWFWGDLYYTVLLGLMGGGLDRVAATRLVNIYMGKNTKPDDRLPLAKGPYSPHLIASAILNATMFGFERLDKPATDGDALGEVPAGESPASGISPDIAPLSSAIT